MRQQLRITSSSTAVEPPSPPQAVLRQKPATILRDPALRASSLLCSVGRVCKRDCSVRSMKHVENTWNVKEHPSGAWVLKGLWDGGEDKVPPLPALRFVFDMPLRCMAAPRNCAVPVQFTGLVRSQGVSAVPVAKSRRK